MVKHGLNSINANKKKKTVVLRLVQIHSESSSVAVRPDVGFESGCCYFPQFPPFLRQPKLGDGTDGKQQLDSRCSGSRRKKNTAYTTHAHSFGKNTTKSNEPLCEGSKGEAKSDNALRKKHFVL